MSEDRTPEDQEAWVARMSEHVEKLGIQDGLHDYVQGMKPTAAEKAMRDIESVLEQHYAGNIFSPEALSGISRIAGRYEIERIGETK